MSGSYLNGKLENLLLVSEWISEGFLFYIYIDKNSHGCYGCSGYLDTIELAQKIFFTELTSSSAKVEQEL